MNAREAIKLSIDGGNMVSLEYLKDLTDEELMHRPHPGCNHINWQMGHLIVSENNLINQVMPGAMPALPAGFAEKYTKDTAKSDDRKSFASKAELMAVYQKQRDATLAALAKQTDADLDKPTSMPWAPNVASVFSLQGGHWLM